jgi:hypothetical protein
MRGDYILANIDLVINGLNIQGLSTVPANNISLMPSARDISGHTLGGTYLDDTREARARISTLVETAFSELINPSTPAEPDHWDVNWNGKNMGSGKTAIAAADIFFKKFMDIENATDDVCIYAIDHDSRVLHYCPVKYVEFPTINKPYKLYKIVDRLDRLVADFQVDPRCTSGYYGI